MKKARAAKANKKAIIEEPEPIPEPEPEPVKKTRQKKAEVLLPLPVPVEVINEPEEPVVAPKKKALPNPKWLKNPKIEPEKCCDEKVSKEEPLITDDKPQVAAERIVVPSKSIIKKPKAIRASTQVRALDITEPEPIEVVLEDIKNNNTKYLPKVRQATPAPAANPVSIKRLDEPLRLFSY